MGMHIGTEILLKDLVNPLLYAYSEDSPVQSTCNVSGETMKARNLLEEGLSQLMSRG